MATDIKKSPPSVTYATVQSNRIEDVHRELDRTIAAVRPTLGRAHPIVIGGQAFEAEETFEDRSPIDSRLVLGHFQRGTPSHVEAAVLAAQEAFAAWSATRWDERVEVLRRLGRLIHGHRFELSALMGFESGKSRMECLGDVEEAADLIEYYCRQFEEHDGFVRKMASLHPGEENIDLLRPYGVWAVIAPFNFPLALAAGPVGAALVAGNTVVFKPASDTPLLGVKLHELSAEAGVPPGVLNLVTGMGDTVGHMLFDHAGVDGIVFTGSTTTGLQMLRENAQRPLPRPMIMEMGGKNPALVMRTADIEKASLGICRSAFSAQGQKCSACSRAYVDRSVRDRFLDRLIERVRTLKIGNPLDRDVSVGPVINDAAVRRFETVVAQAQAEGGRILAGGRRRIEGDLAHGYFVEPTIIDGLRHESALFQQELFIPVLLVAEVTGIDDAITQANATPYGLTAGLYSEDEREIQRFFDRVHAGVTYVNRRGGATTGAWPGVNPFGGWKASGSTGRGSGGPYYVQQFMHEQSRSRA